jgi:AcrR family transcriptional regulator
MSQPDPIQALVAAARRNQILDAAVQVFADKGFNRATIKDVARAAGIADGTIYNYFENKTSLLLGILNRLNESDQREGDFAQAAQTDIRAWMHSYIKQRYDALEPEGYKIFQAVIPEILVDEKLRSLYAEQVINPTYAMAEKFFQQWMDEGIIQQVDAKLAVRFISAAFVGLIILRQLGDTELKDRWDELPDITTELLLNGLMGGKS